MIEGVAAAYTSEGHPAALEGAVLFYGFKRILGAGRYKTATRRRSRGDTLPVKTDGGKHEFLH